jgi:predicted small secreted protein
MRLTPRAPDKCGHSPTLAAIRPQTADSAPGGFVRQVPRLPVTPDIGRLQNFDFNEDNNMKKSTLLIFAIILLSLFTACGSDNATQGTLRDEDQVATIVAGTLEVIPTSSPIPTEPIATIQSPTSTPNGDSWVWHTIELYQISLKLPSGWTISEINRRPDPTPIEVNPTPQHDCAEYIINNSGNTINLLLKPSCGISGGGPDYCPNDIVMFSRQSDAVVHYVEHGDLIGRFYDSDKSAYIYTGIGFPVLYEQIQLACYYPENVSIKKEQGSEFIYVEFQYIGNETDIDQNLKLVDEIVLSIK